MKEEISTRDQTVVPFGALKGELQIKLISPRKVIVFWETSEIPRKVIELFFNCKFDDLVMVVRIYDVTDITFNGKNAHFFNEISVPFENGHWFIKGLVANRRYIVELGVHLSENNFFPLLRSNSVYTPKIELSKGHEFHYDVLQFQQYEDQPPKWVDHVSTYSFYDNSRDMEGNNG
ncbi:MAG TPA: DUF4912 domain-containing protein [Neobacillus sp.]|jgi:hypothetical protein